jgi:hypothetical protein
MTPFAILFTVINAIALLALPRRWAPLPLLLGACYMTGGQGIAIGPFKFTVLRMLIFFGLVRIVARRETIVGGFSTSDLILTSWAGWMLASSIFHPPAIDALIYRSGLVFVGFGLYFIFRALCTTYEDFLHLIRILAILLAPVCLEMIQEKILHRNMFSVFGGLPESVVIRNGKIRAQGPFGHPILAGTVGAVTLPLFLAIWRTDKSLAKIGACSSIGMVLTCASSGPILSAITSIIALLLWPLRSYTSRMRMACVGAYIFLEIVMRRPAYFIIASLDVTGSSTGWHRAELIRSSIQHLNEWWFAGTDFTRHWMPSGVSWSPDHTDITNHYIKQGVLGGLPLMFLLIALFVVSFRRIGETLRITEAYDSDKAFLIWGLGASLLCVATTSISVTFFDQSVVFLYLLFAIIASLAKSFYLKALEPSSLYESASDIPTEPIAFP